jgi:hypothetical protein
MRTHQRGVTLTGLLIWSFAAIIVALFALKLVPAYIEFLTAKKAIYAIASSGPGSVAEVRRAFEARATIDDINAVKSSDLEVTKDGRQLVISFSYRKEMPLVANIGLYIDFRADSRGLE